MNKTFVSGCLIAVLIIANPENIYADYKSARQDYQNSYNSYRELLPQYLSARSEYLAYKTLVSRTRALEITQKFLQVRQEVAINYLIMLEEKLQITQTPYLDITQTNTALQEIRLLKGQLSDEIPVISNVSTLEELTNISRRSDTLLNRLMVLGYKSQALSIDAKTKEYLETNNNFYNSTYEQVRRIAVESQIPTEKFERWLLDAQEKSNLASSTYTSVNPNISKIKDSGSYENSRKKYLNTKQYIKESLRFLQEILRNLKIKQ